MTGQDSGRAAFIATWLQSNAHRFVGAEAWEGSSYCWNTLAKELDIALTASAAPQPKTRTDPKLIEALKKRAREVVPDTAPFSLCIEGAAAERLEQLDALLAAAPQGGESGWPTREEIEFLDASLRSAGSRLSDIRPALAILNRFRRALTSPPADPQKP